MAVGHGIPLYFVFDVGGDNSGLIWSNDETIMKMRRLIMINYEEGLKGFRLAGTWGKGKLN